jgi:dTDP-4-amino-4,6-dideoxy-D-galactose acyltransferase
MIKRLSWDSDFFGIEVGETNSNDTISLNIAAKNYDLIYVKHQEEIKLQGFTCTYQENKVLFSKEISEENFSNENIVSAFNNKTKIDELYVLAFESGKYSRFLLDKNFGRENFEKLYEKWIDNSLNKNFADIFLLYKEDNEIIGLVTAKINENSAQIGLIAVSPDHQGKGIGKKLIFEIQNVLINKGIPTLHIPTQLENKEACFFYKKMGYEIINITPIKHYWKKVK